jgi:hypothetical protein
VTESPADRTADGERLAADARRFAFPRLAGSEGDAAVRGLLADALREAGLVVRESPFGCNPRRPMARFRIGFLVIAATLALNALGVGGETTAGQYVARLLLLISGAAAVVVALGWDEGFFIGGKGEISTANLLGFAGENGGRRVVVVAHHDSKSQTIGFGGRALLLAATIAGVAAFAAEAVLRGAGIGLPAGATYGLTAVIAAGGVAAAAFGLNAVGDRSPGGVDNAGSLAVALEVARRVVRAPEPGGELVVVLTGAEELLMCGARRLVRDRGEVWRDGTALVVNLEALGVPGALGVQGARAPAQRALGAIAAAGARGRRIGALPAAMSDAWPIARAGLPVVTLTAASFSRAVRAIHTPRDRAENLDPAALARAADALEQLVRGAMRP